MKFINIALLAAFAGTANAAPARSPTCADQDPCISFTMTKLNGNSCGLTDDCVIEVCMTVDGSATGCNKGTDSFSHMCSQSDANGCPVYLSTDDSAPELMTGDTEGDCPSLITGEGVGGVAFTGKCSASQFTMCQEGVPGQKLYWVLKDGEDSTGDDDPSVTWPKTFTAPDGTSCSTQVSCSRGDHSCGDNAAQKEKERTWMFEIPESGSCSGCDGAGPTPVISPGGLNPTPTDTPPADAGSKGDPHFKTWVGEHFEFHGQCDLILAKDPKFADDLGLDVQIRTKLVRYWSYIKSAAVRIGEDILEVQGSADLAESKPLYWVNFNYQADVKTIGGFPLEIVVSTVNSRKHKFLIDLDSKYPGVKIEVSLFKEFVKVDFIGATEEAFGNAVGMLGEFSTGKTFGRDQTTEIHDFNQLGNEWQVTPSDHMLFHDVSDPQFPKRCVLPEDPQGQRRRRLEESSVTLEAAEKACASLTDELDRKDCVYDIIATQDMDMVGAF